ncbi:hypothetical protein BBBOND_0308630 [Babesia bigemina]|uniref:Ribosome binding protein n=1 Tax=Babesia bigemina TaxID=5866 RepID=A0A061DEA0_BABBI|nr:hypothetical protein BBBOND_0308630 [Babesia bigemina]CDR96960.1 hypothetical protein BBBOND_0308630 [Babesia bigemina]|eukprot:XP_012769146.1 hypothetical protein BBBOND_0308630 [Babesia bigemina]
MEREFEQKTQDAIYNQTVKELKLAERQKKDAEREERDVKHIDDELKYIDHIEKQKYDNQVAEVSALDGNTVVLPKTYGIHDLDPSLLFSGTAAPRLSHDPAVYRRIYASAADHVANIVKQKVDEQDMIQNTKTRLGMFNGGDVDITYPLPYMARNPDYLELQIDTPKRAVQDTLHDMDLDDLYSNADNILRDEYITSDMTYGKDKGFSSVPQTNFDLDFAPGRIGVEGYGDPGMPRDPSREVSERLVPAFATPDSCQNPWYVTPSSTSPTPPTPAPLPVTDHLPPPKTVREMLYWFVGLNTQGYVGLITDYIYSILKDANKNVSKISDVIEVTGDPTNLDASHVADKLTEACLYGASVLYRLKYRDDYKAYNNLKFESEYSKFRYASDPAGLLCQLRDYVYACHHQLAFLKAQCKRDKLSGGWKHYHYGSDIKTSSPLQAFLTDGWDSTFKTHLFDPCNLCLKSRVRMGFRDKDLPKTSQQGSVISTILTPSCGGSDPLLTLASYLNCLTRRTPRTTGELVSYFHHFGNELHEYALKALSSLGTAITKSHADCPDWDCLGASDLQAVSGLRGSEALNMISNNNHDNEHPKTLSTLVGCGSDPDNCPPHCSPITYRAYALYSQSFAHTYLSWTVYLPDLLWESLKRLHYDLKKHVSTKCSSLYLCSTALPLLYTHGITPPEGKSQSTVKCYDVMSKLKEIVDGKPIASLMTAMDNFLYGIREPFIFTLVALWSLAFLVFANTMLYRLDVLRIRSHLIRTKASHHIDVKALLTKGRKMLSLYKDVDYFDEDPIGYLGVTH